MLLYSKKNFLEQYLQGIFCFENFKNRINVQFMQHFY